jgi:hypothetical protein
MILMVESSTAIAQAALQSEIEMRFVSDATALIAEGTCDTDRRHERRLSTEDGKVLILEVGEQRQLARKEGSMLKVDGEVQVVPWSARQAAQLKSEVHAPLMSEAKRDSSSPDF